MQLLLKESSYWLKTGLFGQQFYKT